MVDIALIKSGFIGEIGWRQNVDTTGMQITGEPLLTATASGLFYNDSHPLLTFEGLASVAPDFVKLGGSAAEQNQKFSTWLKEKTEAGIVQAIFDWMNMKGEFQDSGKLLEQRRLFEGDNNLVDYEEKAGNFVGLEIIPKRSKSLSVSIQKLGLQFEQNQTITVYLFQSGKSAPIDTKNIVYNQGGSVQWEAVDWVLSGEESYWIGYNEDALTGRAVNGAKKYGYGEGGHLIFPIGKYYRATAFCNSIFFAGVLWNLALSSYTTGTNYGLNLEVSVGCDYTNFLLSQKSKFWEVIRLRVAMDMLREMGFNASSRVNRNISNIQRNEVMYEIDGDTQGNNKNSLFGRYQMALNSIRFDYSDIDKVCMKCKGNGVSFSTIG